MFSAEYINGLDKIKDKYEQSRAALLPILHFVQEKEGLITPEAEVNIAEYLGIAPVQVHEVVCFYHLFNRTPKGKCHLSVCQTTACALRGSEEIIAYIEERLKIKPGETTPDGKFSFGVVECLGNCEAAPAMQCNKDYVGVLDKKKIDELIAKYS